MENILFPYLSPFDKQSRILKSIVTAEGVELSTDTNSRVFYFLFLAEEGPWVIENIENEVRTIYNPRFLQKMSYE